MVKRLFLFLLLAGLSLILFDLYQEMTPLTDLSPLASHYVSQTPAELGAQNVVTGIVVTYRGLDTLGEVAVLFLIAAIVGYFLTHSQSRTPQRPPSELLSTAASFLLPILLLVGVSIFMNGHLTPGGGFQGGAVIASGLLLHMLGHPHRALSHHILGILESVSGILYVVLGILGLILAGGFLDPRLLPRGIYGTLLSAGAIPLIYTLVGLKVGAELSGILAGMQATGDES